MYDADAIEAINFEQLATVTDRLLLRGGQPSKRRPGHLVGHRQGHRQGHPGRLHMPVLAPLARGSQPHLEPTLIVRATPFTRAPRSRTAQVQMFALTVVIPALVGIAVGLAARL